MFSSAIPTGRPRLPAQAYRQVGAETAVAAASPHRLVGLLFEAALESMREAIGALRQGRGEARRQAIARALRVIDDGLRAGLDRRAGGRLAADLDDLYSYLALRLAQANAQQDTAALEECVRLLEPLHEAWIAIGSGSSAGPAGPAGPAPFARQDVAPRARVAA
jgi:flagellar protein FliS